MIDNLKSKIETVFGRTLSSSADYDALSQSIQQRVHILLSPTTLKRIFGYLNEDVKPRRTTLDVLAQYMGYRDYDCFVNGSDTEESNPVMAERLVCTKLADGQLVQLVWPPDRLCIVRHEGAGHFTVVEAHNTKLCVGDTFHCQTMIQHEPIYLYDHRRQGLEPSTYVAGCVNGVTYQLI